MLELTPLTTGIRPTNPFMAVDGIDVCTPCTCTWKNRTEKLQTHSKNKSDFFRRLFRLNDDKRVTIEMSRTRKLYWWMHDLEICKIRFHSHSIHLSNLVSEKTESGAFRKLKADYWTKEKKILQQYLKRAFRFFPRGSERRETAHSHPAASERASGYTSLTTSTTTTHNSVYNY